MGYWMVRGRGEYVRLMLNYLKLDYEDKQYKAPDEWGADKASLPMDFPNLPYIFDGAHSQSETIAILEYLANKYSPKMIGGTPEEKGKLAQLRNILTEASNETRMLFYTSGDKQAI